MLPSRALAVAIAEEWDSQKEKIDVQTLKLSQMMAKAVRTSLDPSLKAHMQKELLTILSNDQICFREALGTPNEYKARLAEKQQKTMEPVRKFIRDQFNVNLKVWHNIPLEEQDASVHNIIPVIESLDPWVLNSVF